MLKSFVINKYISKDFLKVILIMIFGFYCLSRLAEVQFQFDFYEEAIESIFKIMGVNKNSLNIRSSYNLAGFSMTPKMIEIELKKIKEKFIV